MEQKSNEDIILIAEFMGWKIDQEGIWAPRIDDSGSERNGLWFCFDEFPIEWNTLMLVVEKIENTDCQHYVDEGRSKINLTHWFDLVYSQVIDFIKWYNENKY